MRRIYSRAVTQAARRLAIAGAGATLAIGVLATLAPVGHASVRQAGARRVPPPPAAYATRMALARLMAERSARAARGLRSAGVATGVITGLIKSTGGAPFAGVCVTAIGPAGTAAAAGGSGGSPSGRQSGGLSPQVNTAASRADGRYLLAGLRPGRYRLRIEGCPGSGLPAGRTPAGVFWPGQPAVVTVLSGQVKTLASAIAWATGTGRLAAGRLRSPSLREPRLAAFPGG